MVPNIAGSPSPAPAPSVMPEGPEGRRVLYLKFDGGARGNPGVAGVGAHIFLGPNPMVELWWGSAFVREYVTNNVAEYEGLILGIEAAVALFGQRHFHFRIGGDSMKVPGQITGAMSCRALSLQDPYRRALVAAGGLASKDLSHVVRAQTSQADELANLAMDSKVSREWLNPDWKELTAVARPAVPSQSPPPPAPSADLRPTPNEAAQPPRAAASRSGRSGSPGTDSDAERPCSRPRGPPREAVVEPPEEGEDPPGPSPTQPEDAPMSPGSAAQPIQIGAPGESPMQEDQPGPPSASPGQPQPEDVPMSPGGAAQPLSVGAPDEARMEEDQPGSASARPNQLQP